MPTLKKMGFRLVSNFRAANQRVEKVPGMMPNQEPSMAKISEAEVTALLTSSEITGDARWHMKRRRVLPSPRRVVCIHQREYRKDF